MEESYANDPDKPHPRHRDSETTRISDDSLEHDPPRGEDSTFLIGLRGSESAGRRGNSDMRASAMQRVQRLQGNRAVQRLVRLQNAGAAVAVQRSPFDDWPGRPKCPLIPIGPQVGCEPLGGGGTVPAQPKPVAPAPHPQGKKGKPPKGKKGGKPGDTDSKGGFTITLKDLEEAIGPIPLGPFGGVPGPFNPRKPWDF